MKKDKKESIRIVRYERGQLWVGIFGTIFLLICYFVGMSVDHKGQRLDYFMGMWGAIMVYKFIRYKIHLNRVIPANKSILKG